MKVMQNKWFVFSLLWLGVMLYGLLRESVPMAGDRYLFTLTHFDKVVHFLLFFGQTWLFSRAFLAAKMAVPYMGLLLGALVLAIATEWGQSVWTFTRQADVWDGVVDVAGAVLALLFAQKASAIAIESVRRDNQ